MAKKIQLSELKVKSFITTLSKDEQNSAKGGNKISAGGSFSFNFVRGGSFTVHKTQGSPDVADINSLLFE